VWIENDTYLELNNSALTVLRGLAAQRSEQYYWIDALCIDQRNPEDKNIQVPMMGRIFSSANRVIASVGSPSEDSNTAIDFVCQLSESIARLRGLKGDDLIHSLLEETGCEFPSPRWAAALVRACVGDSRSRSCYRSLDRLWR
jgi:hypothetical protein